MISMPSFAPSASKSHDKGAKREQNPPYSHYNGLNVTIKTDSLQTQFAPRDIPLTATITV